MQSDATDAAIAEFAREITRRILDREGFITTDSFKDEKYIRGDRIGLLTLGTAILLRITAGETAYQPFEARMNRMLPGGFFTFLGVRQITDDREQARLRRRDKPAWWTCALVVTGLTLFGALACLGLYTIATWLF